MIYIDDRAGSKDLVDPLMAMGLPVERTRLESGDIVFEGRGVGGKPVLVGMEYKKLGEFVGSVRSERLQDIQLPKMEEVGFDQRWLLIEGPLLYDTRGKLLRRVKPGARKYKATPDYTYLEGGMTVGEILSRVFVLYLCGGMTPWWTQTQADTLKAIQSLYRVWTDKDLDQHRSHLGSYQAPTLVPLSDFRKVVMQFPGVGHKASLAVERYFEGSIKRAVMASPNVWADIEVPDDKGKTRKLGRKTADRIITFIQGA